MPAGGAASGVGGGSVRGVGPDRGDDPEVGVEPAEERRCKREVGRERGRHEREVRAFFSWFRFFLFRVSFTQNMGL